MMYKWIKTLFPYIILILSLKFAKSINDYDGQPKIHLRNGDLILEAAYDRNISLHLSHDSSLFVNSVNLMDKIRQRYASSAVIDSETKQTQQFSTDEVKSEIQKLRDDLERFAKSLIIFQNRTRRTLQLGVILRNLGRINRLNGRLLALERKLKKDECAEATEPCKNGGTCYDSYNGFHCECTKGYTGKTCEEDVDECYLLSGTDLGCQNNAMCINTPGSYKCICAKGFSGTHCRLRNAICHQDQSQELCAHGTCVPANNAQGYTCICEQGWRRNTTSTNSTNLASLACDIDINECEESSNPCYSECINLPGSFKCGSCPRGYTGNGMTCFDINECAINNGGCSLLPKVRCTNTEGSYRCGNCPPGWLGDGHTCELAPTNLCNNEKICHPQAKCEYISDVPSCTCPPGMFGHGFGPQGCHTNPINDSCVNHLCQNNGTCVSMGRTTSCLCPTGYSGALCETADGCHPNPCENDATCKPLGSNSFKCNCQSGTTGKRCEILRSVCAKTMRRPSGELKYPTDESPEYSLNERCAWIIRTNPNHILNVTFSKFDLEHSTDCINDWLQIHDGNSLASQLIGRFCGQDLPLGGTILSSHNLLFFWFRSNNATNRPGFEMSWVSQPYICGENLELSAKDVGVIKSPGYPGKTQANRECEWELSAPYGYRFVIRIYDINLGTLLNCTGDALKIYDADLLLKEYCQTSNSDVLRSSSNKLLLHFHTDRFFSDSSFQLHYEVEPGVPHCGGMFTEPTGFILGPSEEATCLYLIKQPLNTQIKWEFLDFEPFKNINCNFNRIEIFDGKTDEAEKLLITCGDRIPEPIVSSSNYMLVRYKYTLSDESNQITVIKAKYSRVCEFRVFGPDIGVLTTPNYPKPYVDHITCTFYIYGPGNSIVLANFTDFSLAESNLPNIDGTSENMVNINNRTKASNLNDDTISYVDVFLSQTNKRRYYKGAPMHLRSERNELIVVFHAATNSEKARGFRLEYSFENTNCGGVFSENKGPIDLVLNGPQCNIIFTADEGNHLKLNLEFSDFKNSAQLLIYANTTNNGDFLLRNVTTLNVLRETFNFNTITLIINTRIAILGSYEFISTTQACGGNFTTLYGALTSPSWPRPYQANLDCIWVISAPLGNKIELQVHNFTLEPTCTGDILEIRNGKFADSPLIGRYCQSQIPSRITSFTNSLYIRFTTDNFVEGPGFYFNWELTSTGCGGKLNSYKGSIHTPHYDEAIEVLGMNNMNLICDWLIVVSLGSSIDLSITTSRDELEFCRKNNLHIYDGASTLSPLLEFNCTSILKGQPLQLKSSSNQLLIIYSLNEETEYKDSQFVMDYITNCNAVIYNYRGVIESPNFPENYPENQKCVWDLRAGRNNKLQLIFSHLIVEVIDMDCAYDYVEILDMKDMDVLKKHRLCTLTMEPITSEGNRLMVRFVSDYSNNKMGFRAEYTLLGCGELMYKEFGYITSPNYPYSYDLDCDWHIEVAPGRQITLTVVEFHIESDQPDCSQNVLLLKETRNSTIELAKECQEQQIPLTITSPANRLYIHFHTSATRSRKYFKAFYHTKAALCGGTFRGTSGYITSTNQPYANNDQSITCIWDISVPESYGILLDFKQFQLNDSPNCTEASMEFSKVSLNSYESVGKFCGSEKPNLKIVHGNHLRVEYKDSGKESWGKFSIHYKKECGGLVTKASGYIKALASEECVWEFDLIPGTLINLHILQLDCYCPKNEDGVKTCKNYLGLRKNNFDNDNLEYGNRTLYLCERHETDMVFEVSKLDIFTKYINFQAKYSTAQYSCGGYTESARGTLISPHYPSTYPSNMDCTWTIQGTKGSFLELQFEKMDIAKSEHCNEDYLEIRTWSEGKVLGLYCGSEIPLNTLISYERFWLRFHSSDGSTGKGFVINWSYSHLNELVNDTKGYITNPPVNMVKNDEEPYSWRIIIPRGQFIQLNFNEYNSGLKLFDGFDDTALFVEIPPSPCRFVTSSNVVFLQTDNENFEIFSLVWNVTTNKPLNENVTINKCHTEEFIKVHRFNAIRVVSPGYPNGYEPNLHCDWIFKPAYPIEHVAIALYEVDLETIGSCSADYLKISTSLDLLSWHKQEQLCNGSNIGKLGESPFLWVHGTPHIKLDFVTDLSINRTGFLAKVVAKCGSNLTDTVGFIDGKMLSDFYEGPNTECLWHVNVKPGKRVRVELNYPSVSLIKEDFDEACSTHVLLYDGVDDHAPLIKPGKLCYPQNVTTLLVNSTSNHLTIKYKLNFDKVTPRLARFSYWNLTYREYSECSEEIRLIPEASVVNITSPQYPNVPQPHTECEWRVVAPQGELIQIEFLERFDMNARYCSEEYVELFDGSTSLSRNLGRYCHKPPVLKTTQNMLYIHYLTDIAEPRNGFKARISISKCGGIFNENHGDILSPDYPGSYPSSSECDFAINLQGKNLIRLKFIDMHLPFDETKLNTTDHLEIITVKSANENIPSLFFYGNTTNNTEIQIASNKVIIRFHTFQKTFKYRGFSLKYNSQGSFCAHVITGVSGIINMNLSAKKHYQNTCTWKLTVPKNQKARLEFLNMDDLKMENISNFISFAIYNNFDLSSEILTFTPNTFDPNTIIESTDNLIYIRVMVPRTDLTLRSLKVRYTSNDESACPHNIETDENSGIINIPGTHPEFTGNFYCGIKIKLNEEETIVFNISILTISGYGVTLYPLVFRDNYVTTYYRNNLTQFIHAQSQKTGSISITQNSQNRIHRLKMSYKKYPCGGKMSVANGQQIKNPQASQSDNSNEILCVWNLFKPYLTYGRDKSNEFKLIGNFTFTESCDNEFVEIIEGQWMNRTLAKKICKDNANEALEYTLTKRITLVLYSSTNYQPQKDTFTLSIEKIFSCSSETSVGVAPSSIRIDKSLYKNNQECSWIFYAKPGVYLQIQFLGRFFIENSINCTKDYLEIQKDSDGLWLPEARFCGREVPDVYNISSSRIQIIFRTDGNITADGFEFVVQTHCNLVVNVTSAQPQFIMSPTKSAMSRRRMHCEYEFLGKESNKLIVVRAKFETDSPVFVRDSCRLGSMTITKRDKDGVDQIPVQHCKLEFEERAYKYLRFAYDAYVGQKFTLEYAYDTCGGNVTTPTIIRPLKHEKENTYAENMNCIWYISAPLEHSIAVRFKYFVTEENYDHLSIYSGPLIKREKLVAKLSGNFSANTPIVVDSNQAVINAISDASDSRKGFEANIVFIANCNERIALTEGNSPVTLARNFKFNSSEEYICKYRITAPKDHRVQVNIKKLQINSANTTCQNIFKDQCDKNCNYLEIFDTPTIQEISVNKFCASTSTNKTFISSKEYATLKLNAAQPGQYNFEIILKMEKTECGLTEYKIGDNEKYKFTFPPNGASQYAANIHCTWRLIATNELEIHFNYIDLQNKSLVTGKCLDYIIVKEPYTSTTLCGRSNNFTINPVKNYENYIDITFHSDDSEEGKGFEFVAQRSDACNRTYDFPSKIIKYRGYGKENEICIDTIVVPENYTLNFFINSLYFKNFDCSKLHLKIIDLKTNETLLNRCQNSYLNINLFTTTHAVRIEASQFSAISILYSASERKLTPGCGGIFTASEAQFASPPYENDRNFSECRWDIQIPTVSHVNLHFYEFNMGAVTNCHLDNVKIIEILPNGTEKLLKTLCGPDTPEIIKTSGSHFAIVSKKSPNFDGTGWTLNYNILNSNTDNPTVIINPHV